MKQEWQALMVIETGGWGNAGFILLLVLLFLCMFRSVSKINIFKLKLK